MLVPICNNNKVNTKYILKLNYSIYYNFQIIPYKNMENLSIKILEEKHLDDAASILAKNFIISNPVWKHYNLPFDTIRVIMRGKLIKALEIDQSFVIQPVYLGSILRWKTNWRHSSSRHVGLCHIPQHAQQSLVFQKAFKSWWCVIRSCWSLLSQKRIVCCRCFRSNWSRLCE